MKQPTALIKEYKVEKDEAQERKIKRILSSTFEDLESARKRYEALDKKYKDMLRTKSEDFLDKFKDDDMECGWTVTFGNGYITQARAGNFGVTVGDMAQSDD